MAENSPKLFHYSEPGGLLGIWQSKSLWLSNIHYQNDADEYYHALELIKKVVEKEYVGLPLYGIDFNRKKIYDVYTFSLSEEKDLLSQWRGYCPSGGYSFSIGHKQLISNLERHSLRLEPVIYDEDKKIEFIKKTIIGFSPVEFANRENPSNQSGAAIFSSRFHSPSKAEKYLRRNILNYASLLKHESFREEKEWRIFTFDVYDAITAGPQEIAPRPRGLPVNFRAASHTLVPYLQMPLTSDGSPVVIDEVVIGPTAHPELSEHSLNLLLKTANQNVVITKSNTPYRNW